MKISITLTPNPDDKGFIYTAETDETEANHPMLDQMRKDLMAVYTGKTSPPLDIKQPALVTSVSVQQRDAGVTSVEIGLAVSVVATWVLSDPRVTSLLLSLGMTQMPKNPNKQLTGKELVATLTIEDSPSGARLVVKDFSIGQ